MNALEYARRNVTMWQQTQIYGAFCETKYPFCIEPLLMLDEVSCKQMTIYGATQSFKTVILQIGMSYLLDMRRKSLIAVCQTDDEMDNFYYVKLEPFVSRIPSLANTTKSGRSGQTKKRWLWSDHELMMCGPGDTESKSATYLFTDEAHIWNVTNPGSLTAFQNRLGGKWDRMEVHATTAANAGTEIDILYHAGQRGEWHLRCIHCDKLIWPLWKEASRNHYNGVEVFQWTDSQSDTETLDSLMMVCPHCDKEIPDTRHNRIDMDLGAKYVVMNPNASIATRSFRWNAFAPWWNSQRELLEKYLKAIRSAHVGDLTPYEDWVKKKEVRSWEGEFPIFGNSTRGRNYESKDIKVEVIEPEHERFAAFDQQEAGGLHFWAQACEYHKSGNSKRLEYARLNTYDDCEAFRKRFGVKDGNVSMDYGQGMREREIFGMCARFHWIALKSTDEEQFAHVYNRAGQQTETIYLPYSVQFLESVTVGTHNQKQIMLPRGGGKRPVPPGFCPAMLWSKPKIYPVFYALKAGSTLNYGIPTDVERNFDMQVNSYSPAEVLDKPTSTVRKIIWRKVAKDDHAWITSCQNLVMAIVRGYFPLSEQTTQIIQPK